MEDPKPRRPSLGIVLGLGVLVLTAGSATAWFAWRAIAPTPPTAEFPDLDGAGEGSVPGVAPVSPESSPVSPSDPSAAQDAQTGEIYWLRSDPTELALVPQAIALPNADNPEARLKATFASLMAGPQGETELATTIPEETELLALAIATDGIHIDLSAAFTTGGGSASMVGRLAQVVYTATALDPNAPVWISVDGEPLTILGGEGVEVSQPITRADLTAGFGITPNGR